VLELVHERLSFSQIVADYYPDLTVEDVQACIQYAMDAVSFDEIRFATPTP
jgi:uncharacterized protein (DUF433 family)